MGENFTFFELKRITLQERLLECTIKNIEEVGMKRVVGLWCVVVFLLGCGFVAEDKEASSLEYEKLLAIYESPEQVKSARYGISLETSEEYAVQLFHASWGKSYLVFLSDRENGVTYPYVSEKMEEEFFTRATKLGVPSVYMPCYLWEDTLEGKKVIFGTRDGYLFLLDHNLQVTNSGSSAYVEMATPPFPVWNRETKQWEFWLVGLFNGDFFTRYRVTSLSSNPAEEYLFSVMGLGTFHGVGIVEPGETNVILLNVRSAGVGAGAFTTFEIRWLRFSAGQRWETNYPAYTFLTNVGYPFVDVQEGYQVYFSLKDTTTGKRDIYRFRYLTFEKMIPKDIRKKLP